MNIDMPDTSRNVDATHASAISERRSTDPPSGDSATVKRLPESKPWHKAVQTFLPNPAAMAKLVLALLRRKTKRAS